MMDSKELTDAQINRQDEVDNDIYNLIINLDPYKVEGEESKIDWDIQMIGEVRDALFEVYRSLHPNIPEDELEMLFYPYIERDNNSEKGEIDPMFGFVLFLLGLFILIIMGLFSILPL